MIIVLTHFNNPFLADGRYLLANNPFGVYVGAVGVSLFLVVSGASLTLNYHSPMNLRTFYWKRFKGIYPMFWIAWALGTAFFFVDTGGRPMNAAPVRSLIWTVLGVDGLVANFQITTAYLLGEWFLGFIILFYVVFPLLLLGVERRPVLTAVVIGVLYAGSLYLLWDSTAFPNAVILTVRLPELAFGMYLVRYGRTVHPLVALPAVGALVAFAMMPWIQEDIATTVVGIACFLVLAALGRYVSIVPVRRAVAWVARYSYPIFLVHHVVIMWLFFFAGLDWNSFFPVQLVAMLVVACLLTFALAVALDRVTKTAVGAVTRAFNGRWWTLARE